MIQVDSPNPHRVLLSTTTSVNPEARLKDEFLDMNCYDAGSRTVNNRSNDRSNDELAYCVEQALENQDRDTGYFIWFNSRKLGDAKGAVIYWYEGGKSNPLATVSCQKN
jgi:hypothetical protein